MTSSSKSPHRMHPVYAGDLKAILAEGYDPQCLQPYLRDLDALYSGPESRIIKNAGQTKTAVVYLDLGKGKEYLFLKQCCHRGFVHQLFQIFRQSKAAKAWSMSLKFSQKKIPVSRPVALIERRRKGLQVESYFLSVFVEEGVNLKTHVNRFGVPFLEDGQLLVRIGDVIGRMHRAGCIHGDLKWSNLMVTNPRGDPRPLLVDLEHGRCRPGTSDAERAKDLARFMVDVHEVGLNADLSETFLQTYFDAAEIASGKRIRFRQEMNRVVSKISKRHKRARNIEAGEDGSNVA